MVMHESEKKKTQMNIALSAEDKKFLKIYAAERDIPVAEVIHRWIEEARKEQNADGRQ